jgi:predicted ferric reductase
MRRSALYGTVAGIFALLVAYAVAARAGLVPGAAPRPEGPSVWVSCRAAGVAAYLALSLEVIFGLFISTGSADRWISRARTVEVHQWLSAVVLGFIAAHALLLLGDGFISFDVLDTIVPFIGPYRPRSVGLGVAAAYVAFVVHWSFSLRRRIGAAAWRKVHYLTFLVFLLATAHGVLAGTDARLPAMTAMYATTTTLVALLLVHRISNRGGTPCGASCS